MASEQVTLRLEEALLSAIDDAAEKESLDRSTMIRKLLTEALKEWNVARAVSAYQDGEITLGRAAEMAGLSQWDLLDELRRRQVVYPPSSYDFVSRAAELPTIEVD